VEAGRVALNANTGTVAERSAGDLLEAKDLHVEFAGVKAVAGVDLALARDEILGLIGPNGAGKSTLVNAITGFVRPSSGTVIVGGQTVTGWAPARLARRGVARTFQSLRLFGALSVLENVEVAVTAQGGSRWTGRRRALELLDLVGVGHRAKVRADSLPLGDEQRVSIARALAMGPQFLLLDEPAAGLNDAESEELVRSVARIHKSFECGILLIEHDMAVIVGLCDRVQVISEGKTLSIGTPDEIRADQAVIDAHLGTGMAVSSAAEDAHADVDRRPESAAKGRRAGAAAAARRGPRREAEMLQLRDLHVSYGKISALRGVSIAVEPGELVAVVGPNGAGKSTMLMTIAGALRPDSGSIEFGAEPILHRKPEEIAQLGISLIPERRRVFTRLTVEENLTLAATVRRQSDQLAADLDDALERFPILRERLRAPAATLSGGQQQQLAIARALVAKPKLFLVDEPSLGLAPRIVEEVIAALGTLRDEGASVLLVEQNVVAALEVADRAYVLKNGQITAEGTSSALLEDVDFRNVYLR
jgi:branched-chain amino acid transport system ATP-binding protein